MENQESKTTKSTPSTKRGRKPKAKGLGDTIEQITTATGIKAAVDWFSKTTGIDCGCEARKDKLNKLLQYSRVQCLTLDEYQWLDNYYKSGSNKLSSAEQYMVSLIHARVFGHKVWSPCTCSPREWKRFIDELNVVYLEYNNPEM
jgi:hypothetical protein